MNLVTKLKKFKEKISNSVLKYGMIACIVILAGFLSFTADLLIKLNSVFSLLVNADQHYAQEIADEYYVLLLETEELDEAVELRERMVKLSMDGLQYELKKPRGCELLRRHRDEKKNCDETIEVATQSNSKAKITRRPSTDIGVGYSPDHVFYCRSDHTRGVWIVGLDLQRGQGEALEMTGRLDEIMTTVSRVREDVSELAIPLQESVEELSTLINKENRIRYFDAVKYKKNYNVPLLPN